MSLESSRTLGGVGAILLAIPFANIVGIILVLIAMKGLADYYSEDGIFKNALYGFIFGIIGVVALVAVIIMLVFGLTVVTSTSAPPGFPTDFPLAGLGLFIVAAVILYIFSLLGAIFYKRALDILSTKSGEKMLGTAGLILLIGAAIPLVGEILKFIAWILAAVGFFSIKTPTQLPTTPPSVSATLEKKFCQYCGTENNTDATYCQKCGKKM